jgi:hypothetical protein
MENSKLSGLIDDYLANANRDLLSVRKYYETLTPEKAIENASEGKDIRGKMSSHQCRVGYIKCREAYSKLNIENILSANSFEELFDEIGKVSNSISNVGELWRYDTTLKIGFCFNIYPNFVYLQSGAKIGAENLFKRKVNRKELASSFPIEFRKMQPYEIENFLCIYKNELSNISDQNIYTSILKSC